MLFDAIMATFFTSDNEAGKSIRWLLVGIGVESGVSVGGIGVIVGAFVGLSVGDTVGKLVAVGTGVSVGFGAKTLQDVNTVARAERIMSLLMDFILSLRFV